MSARFRFIHAADLHIDSPFRGLTDVPAHVRQALNDAALGAARRLTEAAIEHQVDFIVIAGDLYDGADRSLRAQLTLQREWEKLHAHGVQLFVIHGNHDHLSGTRASLTWPPNVHLYGADEVEAYPAYTRTGDLAAYVHGISYANRAVTENLAKRYHPAASGVYQIGLLHANVDGDASHDPYSPCSLTELLSSGFHYWALGHIHIRAVLHQHPHVVYAGNTQGRHAKETGAKGCYLVDVSDDMQTRLSFVPLDSVRFETTSLDITGLETEQSLLDGMERAVSEAAASHASSPLMIRLKLVGASPLHSKLIDAGFVKELLDGLRDHLAYNRGYDETGAWIWVTSLEIRSGAVLQLELLAEEDSFAGELYRLAASMQHDAKARQELMEEALAPLTMNTRLRRLLRDVQDERFTQMLQEGGEMACGMLVQDNLKADSAQVAAEEEKPA